MPELVAKRQSGGFLCPAHPLYQTSPKIISSEVTENKIKFAHMILIVDRYKIHCKIDHARNVV